MVALEGPPTRCPRAPHHASKKEDPMARDWTLAPVTVEWDAVPAPPDSMPPQWGALGPEGDVSLKDTRGAYWRNVLVRPNEFHYEFPAVERRDSLQAVVATLLRAPPNTLVHLYATPGSRNEYYGEWVLTSIVRVRADRARAVLMRLDVQREAASAATAYRSRNEATHAALLRRLLPGWSIAHEPETLHDLHMPSVVRGQSQSVQALSRSYTCDFVACRGCRRVCIESKPCTDHVTPAALAKVHFLRDRSLTRVFFMVGSGEDVIWLDTGPPGSDEEAVRLTTDDFLHAVGEPPRSIA